MQYIDFKRFFLPFQAKKFPYNLLGFVVIAVQQSFLIPLFIHPRLTFKKKLKPFFADRNFVGKFFIFPASK